MAGSLILSLTNLLLCATRRRPLDTPGRIAPFILACGAAWELLPFVYKPWGVFDWLDFAAYFAGAALYYFTGRITGLLRTD